METMRSTVKQLETKNQEMQRQSASLERDLLAERAIKEQKIKVEMMDVISLFCASNCSIIYVFK